MTCTTRIQSSHATRGFTLVELMVAITIGLIILGAVAQIFVISRASYNLQDDLARLQENGRFSMNFITQDLRSAGYAGCSNVNRDIDPTVMPPVLPAADNPDYTVTNNLNNFADEAKSFAAGLHIQSYDYAGGSTWNPALPAFLAGQARDDGDIVIIRRGSAQSVRLETQMATLNADLDIPDLNELALSVNDVVLVSDCLNVDVFQLSGAVGAAGEVPHVQGVAPDGNQTDQLAKPYGTDAQVMKLVAVAYFLGTDATTNRPVLMRSQMEDGAWGPALALIEDVESMQLLYGIDTDNPADGSANTYVTADAVGVNMPRVVSIRVGLLVSTPVERGTDLDMGTYNVLDANIDPTDDRRQRRIFTSTIQLRNTI